MRPFPNPSFAPIRRAVGRAARGRGALAAALFCAGLSGLVACARPEPEPLTNEDLDRDRTRRSELADEIAADHQALARVISDPRFEDKQVIYTDVELRAIAKRLVERTRKLSRLADTDVLAPVPP